LSSFLPGVGPSKSADDPELQQMLGVGYHKDKYTKMAPKGAFADLIGEKKYWDKYPAGIPVTDPRYKSIGKIKKAKGGKERTSDEVTNLIKEDGPLDNALKARKNQPSLVLYKSVPTSRKNSDGSWMCSPTRLGPL